jgi:cytochrome c-type biogenesis protein CcmE
MEEAFSAKATSGSRWKFIIGGVLIFAAIVYLIFSSTQANAQYFYTIEELQAKGQDVVGQDVRVSGAVLGDSIQYDAQTLQLSFTVANVPGDNKTIEAQGGLAAVLHAAVEDPNLARQAIVYVGPKPDLLRNEAQAIMTGHMGEDGIFYADELLLKCPTKYEEAVPDQVEGNG